MTVTILGKEALLARLIRGVALGEAAKLAGQEQLARDVENGARARAPVATGTLAASIDHTVERVYTDVSYAPFVEYGTSRGPAQPFMRPAADTVNGTDAEGAMKHVMDGI